MPSSPSASLPEGEPERLEQRARLVVVFGRRYDRDVHAPDAYDLVVLNLGEDQLLGHAERVVARAVHLRRQPAEVADTGQRDRQQPVEELPHPVTAKRYLRADRLPLAELEVRDRLARFRDERSLTGDRGEVLRGALDQLRVLQR